MPPPSSGGIVVAMTANMLSTLDLGKLPLARRRAHPSLVEVWRRAYAARNEILGDPAYVKDMPLAKLMSQAYADQLVKTITDKATPSKDVAGADRGHAHDEPLRRRQGRHGGRDDDDAQHVVRQRRQVAGFLLNNEMDDFTTKPGSPNVYGLVQGTANKIEPGKRMLSSMSPTILEDEHGDVVHGRRRAGRPAHHHRGLARRSRT